MLPHALRDVLAIAGGIWLSYRIYREFMRPKIQANISADGIRALVKQTARWSLAAGQDKNPVIAMLHANYGVGYWSALRSLATLDTIQEVGRIDATAFERRILNAQARAAIAIIRQCPAVAPSDGMLARLAHGTL